MIHTIHNNVSDDLWVFMIYPYDTELFACVHNMIQLYDMYHVLYDTNNYVIYVLLINIYFCIYSISNLFIYHFKIVIPSLSLSHDYPSTFSSIFTSLLLKPPH